MIPTGYRYWREWPLCANRLYTHTYGTIMASALGRVSYVLLSLIYRTLCAETASLNGCYTTSKFIMLWSRDHVSSKIGERAGLE